MRKPGSSERIDRLLRFIDHDVRDRMVRVLAGHKPGRFAPEAQSTVHTIDVQAPLRGKFAAE